jgi:hypothetical protein
MKKELKIYWCPICDKIHRKSSKKGKEHYGDATTDFSNNGHH